MGKKIEKNNCREGKCCPSWPALIAILLLFVIPFMFEEELILTGEEYGYSEEDEPRYEGTGNINAGAFISRNDWDNFCYKFNDWNTNYPCKEIYNTPKMFNYKKEYCDSVKSLKNSCGDNAMNRLYNYYSKGSKTKHIPGEILTLEKARSLTNEDSFIGYVFKDKIAKTISETRTINTRRNSGQYAGNYGDPDFEEDRQDHTIYYRGENVLDYSTYQVELHGDGLIEFEGTLYKVELADNGQLPKSAKIEPLTDTVEKITSKPGQCISDCPAIGDFNGCFLSACTKEVVEIKSTKECLRLYDDPYIENSCDEDIPAELTINYELYELDYVELMD